MFFGNLASLISIQLMMCCVCCNDFYCDSVVFVMLDDCIMHCIRGN